MSELASNTENQNGQEEVQQLFLRKALVSDSTALVQSVMLMPDTFVMPGFKLVELEAETPCEAGMFYDEQSGTFSDYVSPEVITPPEEEPIEVPVSDVEPVKAEPEKEPEDIVNVDDTDPLTVGGDEPTE